MSFLKIHSKKLYSFSKQNIQNKVCSFSYIISWLLKTFLSGQKLERRVGFNWPHEEESSCWANEFSWEHGKFYKNIKG